MPVPRVRIHLTMQGYLHLRNLRPEVASVTSTTMRSHAAVIRPQLPEATLPLWDEIQAALQDVSQRLDAVLDAEPPPPATSPEPPAALLDHFERPTLTDRQALNHLIDALVGSLEGVLSARAASPRRDDMQRDAQALCDVLFDDGKRYLTFSHKLQWRAVKARFGALTDAQRARLERLGLAQDADLIAQVNAWFGDLLGVSSDAAASLAPSDPDADHLNQIMEDFLLTMRRLVGLANALPDGPDVFELAGMILGPYLEPVFSESLKRSKATREGQRHAAEARTPPNDEAGE